MNIFREVSSQKCVVRLGKRRTFFKPCYSARLLTGLRCRGKSVKTMKTYHTQIRLANGGDGAVNFFICVRQHARLCMPLFCVVPRERVNDVLRGDENNIVIIKQKIKTPFARWNDEKKIHKYTDCK